MTAPYPHRFFLLALAPLLFGLGGCNRSKSQPVRTQKAAVPVVIGEVIRKDMPVIVRAIGRVTSSATVSIKPQVTGTISEVHFTDGQSVRKGDPLFTMDKRPFEVALDQAKATLAEAQVKAENASTQAKRYSTLDKSGSVSKEQLSDIASTAQAALSTVQVAAAGVKNAELQLAYCSIHAPIDGRAGKALVTEGNVVSANQTDLVVVNQIAPVQVTFAVAEQHLMAVQRGMAGGKPKVTARTSGIERQNAVGELIFVDNTVKASTGTLELKAAFANDPQVLWPGQFVGLRVEVGIDREAVVAPAAAVQDGQGGSYVFVIGPDKKAEMRKVVVDRSANEESVIRSGLTGGEQIVIDGQSRLTVGSVVEIVPPAPGLTSVEAKAEPVLAKP
ncbi:MAG: efflux transporter, family, subunit [Chthoniobacteraceae bacterium]|nr:efflux transporter, family, subunit [Chthoniobacteraceae bacterium]